MKFLHAKHRRNIFKVLLFGFIWFVFGVVYVLIEKGLLGDLNVYPSTANPYHFRGSLITAFFTAPLMGLILGAFEVYYLNNKFIKTSFGLKLLYKTNIYVISIFAFLISTTFLTNSIVLDEPIFSKVILNNVFQFVNNFAFFSIVLYIGIIITITLFVSEISDNIGQGVLKNFFIGKYHTPKIEERIFMFLDMKSSTTIAEKLGHVKYLELLNDYYADLTNAILET